MSVDLTGAEEATIRRGENAIPVAGTRKLAAPQSVAPARTRAGVVTVLMFALAITSSVGWWFLVRDWGVLEHFTTPFFSFEKVEGEFDSSVLRRALVWLLVIGFSYAGILAALRRLPVISLARRVAIVLALVGPAVGSVLLYPVGALDVFNYLAEIKLAFYYDQNPYLVTLSAFQEDSFARSAFLVDIPLFYGPVWLLVSAIPLLLVGFSDALTALIALKVFHLALLGVIAALIAVHLPDSRARWIGVVFFLANPLVLFEGVANVHNDAVMTVFIVAALASLKRRSALAGPLLALAVMVKLYAAALAPLFIAVALRDRWPWRRSLTTTALALATMALVSMPYWADGRMIDGFEAGLEQSQFMDHVSVFSLVQQREQQEIAEDAVDTDFVRSRPAHEILPAEVSSGIRSGFMKIFLGLTLALALAAWKGRAEEIVAGETLLLLLLFTTNLYAWYLIPVIAIFAMRRDRLSTAYTVVATVLGLAYYPMYVYAHYNTEWHRYDVHLFLAIFLTVPILLYLLARMMLGIWSLRRDRAMSAQAAMP